MRYKILAFITSMVILSSVFVSAENINIEINGQIKEYHNNGSIMPLGGPTSVTFECLSYDGDIYKIGGTYSSAWSATSGTTDYNDNNFTVGQQAYILSSSLYAVSRGFVYFDTSSLPDNANIISATLSLYCYAIVTYNDFEVVIQNGQPNYPNKPMVSGDYDKSHYSGDGGSLDSSDFTVSSYNDITLNSNGRSWIKKQGSTKLCLRTDRDINGNSPYEGSEIGLYFEAVGIYPKEKGTNYVPKLTVTYETSVIKPSVETKPADYVGTKSAWLNGKILADGGEACEGAFKWKEEDETEWTATDWSEKTLNTDDWFDKKISGLTPGTTYEFKAGARNSEGTTWSIVIESFTTKTVSPPDVDTLPASEVDENWATLNGVLTSKGNLACKMRFRYKERDATDWKYVPSEWKDYGSSCPLEFSEFIWNLESGTTYVYCAGAKNEKGTTWGDMKEFTTSYYFIHITDTHIGTTGSAERTSYIIDKINDCNPQPEFVIISGDITHYGGWRVQDWFVAFEIIGNLKVPVYICVGNHDHFLDQYIVEQIILDKFKDYHKEATGNLHLISMDSGGFEDWFEGWIKLPLLPPIPIIDWLSEGTGLNAAQWSWLNGIIGYYPDHHKILFMHHPIVCDIEDINYPHYGEGPWKNGCISNYRSHIMSFCRDEDVKMVLGGHTHSSAQYVVDVVNGQNKPRTLKAEDGNDGYHEINVDEGYWNCNELDQTIYLTTGACAQSLIYRKIEVINDEVRVYNANGFSGNPGLTGYQMDLIPWPWGGKGGGPGGENATGRLHLYDSQHNHVGYSGGPQPLSAGPEIEGAYYEDEPIVNETNGEFYNWTNGEFINVIDNEEEKYKFVLEVFLDSNLNLTGEFLGEDNGGKFTTLYKNIKVFAGSIGWLDVNNGIPDYTLYIDDNDDGEVDREFQPDNCEGNRRPKKPEKPSGSAKLAKKIKYNFKTSTFDLDYDSNHGYNQIYYKFDWGDGQSTKWLGPYESGETVDAEYSWNYRGSYFIRVKAKDNKGGESKWSEPLKVKVGWPFARDIPENVQRFPILSRLLSFPIFEKLLQHPLFKNLFTD